MEIKRHKMVGLMIRGTLLNNRHISIWTLLTLATCAALVTLFSTVTAEIGSKLGHELRTLGANAVAYSADGSADWTRFDETIQRVGAHAAQLTLRVQVMDGKPVAIVTADPESLAEMTPYWKLTGSRPQAVTEFLAGRRVANTLGWKLGQEIDLSGESRRLVGLAETGDEDEDRIFVSASASTPDNFRYALVSVSGGETRIEQLQRELATNHSGIEVRPLRQILYGEQQVLTKVNILFGVTLAAVLVLTALGVSASMLARVVERRKEFALLQAIGASKAAVATFLLAENAILGVIGALVGYLAGTVMAIAVVAQIFQVVITPQWVAFATATTTTLAVALLAGSLACIRTLRWLPATALKGE